MSDLLYYNLVNILLHCCSLYYMSSYLISFLYNNVSSVHMPLTRSFSDLIDCGYEVFSKLAANMQCFEAIS